MTRVKYPEGDGDTSPRSVVGLTVFSWLNYVSAPLPKRKLGDRSYDEMKIIFVASPEPIPRLA